MFTKLHDRRIRNVGVGVRVGVGPMEFQLNGDGRREDDAERDGERISGGSRRRRRRFGGAVGLRQVAGDRPVRGRHRGGDRRQRGRVRDRGDAPAHAHRHQLLHREPGVQRRRHGDALHPDHVRRQRARPPLAVRRHALPRRLLLAGTAPTSHHYQYLRLKQFEMDASCLFPPSLLPLHFLPLSSLPSFFARDVIYTSGAYPTMSVCV